jgi:diaminohydroxyphosphoribosylaminopyrimidine deaminase / 5-amino-6-(5-phosphoribosylamino)uracil reductase
MTKNNALSVSESYMFRCLELALLGAGYVAPNPMVGAVLVYDNRIIGEGYHHKYGEAHAEVNCIDSVKEEDRQYISQSVLYVSLEPCAHHGKTPPCTDLIIRHNISKVVIGCRDPFTKVDGKGIGKLKAAGIDVKQDVLETECKDINKRFLTFHTQHRPYIILKWAQTADLKISSGTEKRLFISNEYSNRLVHRWRSEEAAILIGTNTASYDDPGLTTRLWDGPSPIRLVVDMDLSLPSSLKIFNQQVRTIIFNTKKHEESDNLLYYQVTGDMSLIHQIVNALYQMRIQSVIVEGGARLIQSFIDEQMWDEARVITNTRITADNGLPAPQPGSTQLLSTLVLHDDTINTFIQPDIKA